MFSVAAAEQCISPTKLIYMRPKSIPRWVVKGTAPVRPRLFHRIYLAHIDLSFDARVSFSGCPQLTLYIFPEEEEEKKEVFGDGQH